MILHIDVPPAPRETIQTDDVLATLAQRFGSWPDGARLYHGQPSDQTDVTPCGDADQIASAVNHLRALDGTFYVVQYPQDPSGGILSTIGLALFNWAVGAFLAPDPITPSGAAQRVGSPNNELAARTNRARIGERIEDIFGQVRAIPSLIAQPYMFYENNVEFEFAAFCLGRGEYNFDETPRDGDTEVTSIDGVKVNAFDPGRNPNAGNSPNHSWGGTIGRKIDVVSRNAAVNGQTLEAPNARVVTAPSADGFDYVVVSGSSSTGTGRISCEDPNIDLEGIFNNVSSVALTDGPTSYGGVGVTVNGTYDVVGVGTTGGGDTYVDLDLSSESSANWAFGSTTHTSQDGTLASQDSVQIGPFTVGDTNSDRLSLNYVALNGLYKTNGNSQIRQSVTVRVVVSKSGETSETFDRAIAGSAALRETIGETELITPTFNGPYTVTIERLTDTDREEGFQVVDEIKVRDLYSLAPSVKTASTAFGDVTVITAQTQATAGALSVSERQLNMLVTRLVNGTGVSPNYTPTDSENVASKRIHQILGVLARKVCGLSTDDVDWVNLYNTHNEIVNYFGFDASGEFSYTFDDLSISPEETLQTVARAVFCNAYRDPDDGGKLKFRFEKATTDSSLLFNHRNTIPNSVSRTIRFGYENDYDGVEVTYIDDETDLAETVTLPTGTSPVNPRKVTLAGVRGDGKVAELHAHRLWNKIKYGNTRDEREVTDEAALLSRLERVEIADETRADSQTGDIVSQDGLNLTLSQPYTLAGGTNYIILIQQPNATLDSVPITAGADNRTVTLDRAPSQTLTLGVDAYARATYWIVPDVATARGRGFLVEQVTPSGSRGMRRKLTSINYDSRYYQYDDTYA
jgi:hypothetical protein